MKYGFKSKSFVLPILFGILTWYLYQSFETGVIVFLILLLPASINLYKAYSKDNPNHLWFKRKLYGWGWTPVTLQGWLTTLIYVGLLVGFGLTIDQNSPAKEVAFTFIIPAVLLTATFIRIAYKKGEKPRWQWGDDGK